MNDDAGSVFCVSRGDGAPWGSGSQSRAPAGMPKLCRTRAKTEDWKEGRTTLGLNSALAGRLLTIIRPDAIFVAMPQRKHSASRTSLHASKTLGLPLPLTREPPRRRRIKATRFHCSTPTF